METGVAVPECGGAEVGCGPLPSPGRAIIGFVTCVLAVVCGVVYSVWAVCPQDWLLATGLDYWPQRQWALIVPTLLVLAVVLLVLSYPLIGMLQVPRLDDTRVLFDHYSRPPSSKPGHNGALPPAYDISPSVVCRTLYGTS